MKEAYVIFNSLGEVLHITSSMEKAEEIFKEICVETYILEEGQGVGADNYGNTVYLGCGPTDD